jgi:hypothetical protein
MSKPQLVIRDAGIGEKKSAGQHIYCSGCGHAVYGVQGCAAVKCKRCHKWTTVGPVMVRPAEAEAAESLKKGGRR